MMCSEYRGLTTDLVVTKGFCVSWENQPTPDKFALRRDQLSFRRLETYLTYPHFRKFIESTLDTKTGEHILLGAVGHPLTP